MTPTHFSTTLLSYLGRTRVASTNAMPLAILLAKAAPTGLDASQRRKLHALVKAGAAIEHVHGTREAGNGAAIQPLRHALASGFAAVDLALSGMALLPTRFTDKGTRAQQLRAILFPDGRTFTNAAAAEATMTARRVLARIDDKKLAGEIAALIGPEHLQTMRAVTDDLAEALGLGDTILTSPCTTAVSTAMTKYTTALCAYTRALSIDVDDDDEATCQRFLRAVAPIDRFRITHASATEEEDAADAQRPVVNDSPKDA